MAKEATGIKAEWEKPQMEKMSLKDAESGTLNANDDGGATWS